MFITSRQGTELATDERVTEYELIGDQVPGLMINGKLAWAGSAPTKKQVTEWLQQALASSGVTA
jgi:hypothetical protein